MICIPVRNIDWPMDSRSDSLRIKRMTSHGFRLPILLLLETQFPSLRFTFWWWEIAADPFLLARSRHSLWMSHQILFPPPHDNPPMWHDMVVWFTLLFPAFPLWYLRVGLLCVLYLSCSFSFYLCNGHVFFSPLGYTNIRVLPGKA